MNRGISFLLSVAFTFLGSSHLLTAQDKAPFKPANPQPGPAAYSLQDLIAIGLAQNPALQQANLSIQGAQGKAWQSGLYPNPTVSFSADELGDRTGPAGILTPAVSQEIVTAGKLKLNRAVASREVDQATLMLQNQRYALFTVVRQGYFEVLALQQRVAILTDLVKLARTSQDNAEALRKAKQIAELDVLPLELEFNRLLADLEASQREWVAAWRRLAANVGEPNLPMAVMSGTLDQPLPIFDFEKARDIVLEIHPEVNFAKVGTVRADLALRRAEVEKYPNVTLSSGYTRQSQNRSNDWMIGVSVPVPLFNRNQGNVLTAQADVGKARLDVARVQNDLSGRLATAFGNFSAAKQRVDRYKNNVLPTATKSYQLSLAAFKGGQFEYLRVIQAQRAVSEANLEYIRALGDAWRAGSEIAGLLLEDNWPDVPGPVPGVAPKQ